MSHTLTLSTEAEKYSTPFPSDWEKIIMNACTPDYKDTAYVIIILL